MNSLPLSTTSYAEDKEDLLIAEYCAGSRIPIVSYLEIGTNHPIISNNTYFFYRRGIRGVLAEPYFGKWQVIQENRPEDVLIKAGIWHDKTPVARFKKRGRNGGGSYCTTKDYPSLPLVPLVYVNDVFEKYFKNGPPTLISIDIEGNEINLLKEIDLSGRHRIPVICVETNKPSQLPITPYLEGLGYRLLHKTTANSIFACDTLSKFGG